MHNYVVNGDFSNGLDDNWYNSNADKQLRDGCVRFGYGCKNTENILKQFLYTAEFRENKVLSTNHCQLTLTLAIRN